jgi:hypothetical protein
MRMDEEDDEDDYDDDHEQDQDQEHEQENEEEEVCHWNSVTRREAVLTFAG